MSWVEAAINSVSPGLIRFPLQGLLDFLTYPEQLCVADLLPNMINGVLLCQCLDLGRRERNSEEEEVNKLCDCFRVEVQDSTGLCVHCQGMYG